MFIDIFNDIVDIMHYDYAGCIDKKGWDTPAKYKENIKILEEKNHLTSRKFVDIVQNYLLDFKDRHMAFRLITNEKQKEYDDGFNVRRYGDKLYVTSLGKENRLNAGDAIVSLDKISIPKLVTKHQRELMETVAEREDWRRIIDHFSECEIVQADGTRKTMKLKKYEKDVYVPEYSIRHINQDTICIMLTDFMDLDAIHQLLENHEKDLNESENWIIDVRVNYGGSGNAFDKIIPYLFEEGKTTLNINADYAMHANYTQRNCDLLIDNLREKEKEIKDTKMLEMIRSFIQELEESKGKGFVSSGGESNGMQITGKRYPKDIIVLSDVYCGSAGDIFVHVCTYSPKVTIIGRPTAGLNDYSNLAVKKWDDLFELYYPTTRLDELDDRDEEAEVGIQPDIYIPWTPEHLERDVEMERALELLHVVSTYK